VQVTKLSSGSSTKDISNHCKEGRLPVVTLDAAIACTGCISNILLGSNEGSLWFGRSRLWLWWKSLGCAVNDLSVFDGTLDHPVVIALACNTALNTALAEIKITIITSVAVIVLIWDGTFTVVAVNRKDADGRRSREAGVGADSILTLIIDASELSKPSVAGSGAAGNRDLGAWARIHLGGVLGDGRDISL
jgi:hypothetical protein